MAFMAVRPRPGGSTKLLGGTTLEVEELGVVRAVMDIDLEGCEYTILIRSDMKGRGLGHLLTDKIVSYCKARGVKTMTCSALSDNQAMLMIGVLVASFLSSITVESYKPQKQLNSYCPSFAACGANLALAWDSTCGARV
eukprot:843468-Amphidinium_carterae.1